MKPRTVCLLVLCSIIVISSMGCVDKSVSPSNQKLDSKVYEPENVVLKVGESVAISNNDTLELVDAQPFINQSRSYATIRIYEDGLQVYGKRIRINEAVEYDRYEIRLVSVRSSSLDGCNAELVITYMSRSDENES